MQFAVCSSFINEKWKIIVFWTAVESVFVIKGRTTIPSHLSFF